MSANSTNILDENYKLLNTAGLRSTSQRALILDIIHRGRGHLDADEVYRRARKKKPRLSLSTVYRNLLTLKELGLIEEVHFDEGHHHYEIKPSIEHHHLVCLGCGKVVEFECPVSQKMKEDISREKDFKVITAEVRMTGYCPTCRQTRE